MTLTTPATGPWSITSHSIDTVRDGFLPPTTSWNNQSAWGTANRAIYVPVRVPRRVVVRQLGAEIYTTGTGNIDIGIYDAGGTRIVSTGSTAKGTTESTQVVDITDTTLGPGLYYFALNNSTTTDDFVTGVFSTPSMGGYGILSQAVGAVTLPATATWVLGTAVGFCPAISALLVTEVS